MPHIYIYINIWQQATAFPRTAPAPRPTHPPTELKGEATNVPRCMLHPTTLVASLRVDPPTPTKTHNGVEKGAGILSLGNASCTAPCMCKHIYIYMYIDVYPPPLSHDDDE